MLIYPSSIREETPGLSTGQVRRRHDVVGPLFLRSTRTDSASARDN